MVYYFVQLGIFGHVGRLAGGDPNCRRGDWAVCQTERGLELGKVLSRDESDQPASATDGHVLRKMTDTDRLLQTRIETRRDQAWRACDELLRQAELPVRLIDVEHLFDGAGLFFYFLGPRDERLDEITERLAATYEAKVKFREFTERVAKGCGPDCGSESKANGCGTSGCASCALTGGCGTSKAAAKAAKTTV